MQGSYSNRSLSKDMFFDLHVHGNENIIKEAERLGYAGIAVTRYFEDYNSEFSKEFEDLEASSNILAKKVC